MKTLLKIGLTALIFLLAVVCVFYLLMNRESDKIANFRFVQMAPNETRAYYALDDFYIIQYVAKENVEPFFGLARNEFGHQIALIRDDLPGDVKKFVMMHELYHLQDNRHKNFVAREFHASLAAAPYSLSGFIKTTIMSLTDFNRVGYYLKRLFYQDRN